VTNINEIRLVQYILMKWELLVAQPRTQGICSWGAKYPGMAWSCDPWILRKMAYCLLGSGE
jgi:hypothetical protein